MTKKSDVPQDPVVAAPTSPSDKGDAGQSSSKKAVAIGAAAVGIGSAAIVAALLYTRRR